ncbi:DUF2514 domain-containing protein [Aeromonas enteropelogenes]|uniref:DUF2514 domain-containing protein n=1 Tax=Aeromonas enteropelogenes TaxID=29489 RepID=UPI0005A64F3C|nr:DUF2514 domain-containing protein [Aeromonas enteropelogenes]UBH57080.1 DUF2514 domain-containing protein [Aeromonas enteropelogenes]
MFSPYSGMLPFLAGALIVIGLVGGGTVLYLSGDANGEERERKTWQAKWNAEAAKLATARVRAERTAREEEMRRQTEISEVKNHAQAKIAQAQADAVAAGLESDKLRQQARRLAARASQCACGTCATQGSPTTQQSAMVLAELLSRADKRAGELAAAYDRARATGLACERAYDALRTDTIEPRP